MNEPDQRQRGQIDGEEPLTLADKGHGCEADQATRIAANDPGLFLAVTC